MITHLDLTSDPELLRLTPRSWLEQTRFNPIWVFLIALVATMGVISESFFTLSNALNVLRQVTIVGLVAVGITGVVMVRNLDLSVGAIMTLGAVVSINLQPVSLERTVLAVVVPLALGVLVGLFNGVIVGALKSNSIVVTIGTQFMVLGITLLYTGGQHVWVWMPHPLYAAISGGYFLGVPNPVYIFLVVVALAHLLLTRTVFGRYARAIGHNEEAARLSGVPTELCRMMTFVLAGLCAALAGVVLGSRVENLDPTAGIGYEFTALTAVVLGGASLTGGRANVLNTLAGVLLLGVISNSMTLLNISFNTQLLVKGLTFVTAVALGVRSQRAPT